VTCGCPGESLTGADGAASVEPAYQYGRVIEGMSL
jgi:hypothetical protein